MKHKSKKPVLMGFIADNGLSSFLLRETLHELDTEAEIRIVDASNTSMRKAYNVLMLPCVVLIKDGIVTDRIIGVPGRESLLSLLQ